MVTIPATQNLSNSNASEQDSESSISSLKPSTTDAVVREYQPSEVQLQKQLAQRPIAPIAEVIAPPKRRGSANGIPPLAERYELTKLQGQQVIQPHQQIMSKKSEGDYERIPYFEDFYPDDFEEVVYLDEEE